MGKRTPRYLLTSWTCTNSLTGRRSTEMFTSQDRRKCELLYEKYYAGRKFYDARYRELIRKYVSPGHRLLDAGCGRYMKFCKELSDTARVVGIDLDSVLETDNQRAPFGIRGDLSR